MAKRVALLFGLNYENCATGQLKGCVNDVENMAKFLKGKAGFAEINAYVTPETTTRANILLMLRDVVLRTHRENIESLWIHYSGHGGSVRDYSGDEHDAADECLVPSDYETAGVLLDDEIAKIFAEVNPKTRLVLFFDCCHSGTIADLRYRWVNRGVAPIVESKTAVHKGPIFMISGCMDSQTSADAYNVAGDDKFSGAMTSCLLKSLEVYPNALNNVFDLLHGLRFWLQEGHFEQVPQLCTSHDARKSPSLLPTRMRAVLGLELEPEAEPEPEPCCSCVFRAGQK